MNGLGQALPSFTSTLGHSNADIHLEAHRTSPELRRLSDFADTLKQLAVEIHRKQDRGLTAVFPHLGNLPFAIFEGYLRLAHPPPLATGSRASR